MTTENQTLWQRIEYSSLGDYLATDPLAFPMIETFHVIAIVTVLGAIAIMDLRMMGLASKTSALTKLSNETIKLTWIAFVFAAITGSLLFISKASSYMINPYFMTKMVLIAIAGLNMLYFHFFTWKQVDKWDTAADIPTNVKIAGALSLTLWLMVVFLGRAIGFTLSYYFSY